MPRRGSDLLSLCLAGLLGGGLVAACAPPSLVDDVGADGGPSDAGLVDGGPSDGGHPAPGLPDGGLRDGGDTDGGIPAADGGPPPPPPTRCERLLGSNDAWSWRPLTECGDEAPCWLNPLPHGHSLWDVWVDDTGAFWGVGDVGTVVRASGSPPSWERLTDGWGNHVPALRSVFGFSRDDVWVGAWGALLHWDGERFTCHEALDLTHVADIWGASSHDVWAVGDDGYALHWDGVAWSEVALSDGPLRAVHGSAADDVWAVGDDSQAFHWDGSTWSARPVTAGQWPYQTPDVEDVYVPRPGRAWVTTAGGTVEWNGAEWVEVEGLGWRARAVWGSGEDDVWVVGPGRRYHYDGVEWAAIVDEGADGGAGWGLRLYGSGLGDAWLVAPDRPIERWDGASWRKLTTGSTQHIVDLLVVDETTAWSLGERGAVLRWSGEVATNVGGPILDTQAGFVFDGALWTRGPSGTLHRLGDGGWQPVSLGGQPAPSRLWASPDGELWGIAPGNVLQRWDGATWTSIPTGLAHDLQSLSGTGTNDVWVAGFRVELFDGPPLYEAHGVVAHWDGAELVSVELQGSPLYVIHATAPDDVWAGGEGLWRWRGGEWLRQPEVTGTVRSIWAGGADDVWFVSTDWEPVDGEYQEVPRVHRWDGSSVQPVSSTGLSPGLVSRIWGDGAGGVWLLDGPRPLLWSGSAWEPDPSFPGRAFITGMASHGDDVWAFGRHGVVLHREGDRWRHVGPAAPRTPTAIWPTGAEKAWVVDEVGRLSLWSGGSWSLVDTGVLVALADVWGEGDEVWAVGEAGTVVRGTAAGLAREAAPVDEDLRSVWGSSPSDVWVVGRDGAVARYDGGGWTRVDLGSTADVERVLGPGADDVWVFAPGELHHWDGQGWARTPAPYFARDVALSAAGPVFLAEGSRGGYLLRGGPDDAVVRYLGVDRLFHMRRAPDGSMWLGGAAGRLLRIAPP